MQRFVVPVCSFLNAIVVVSRRCPHEPFSMLGGLVGRPNDGVNRPLSGALLTPIDKPWGEQFQELADAREAWRRSPLARRFVQLITAYVVGNGVYAVNRPIGALRGESDLAPILPWMQRYSRWLEDRVRLSMPVCVRFCGW
jgi:hypothetical protein